MSHMLELLGRGLQNELGDMLDRFYWSPSSKSIEQLRAECDENPDWPDIQFQLGLAYLRSMQIEPAIEHLSHACRYKPDYLAARLALASALEENSEVAKSLEQLEIANQIQSGEPVILFGIGFCNEKIGRPEKAAEYYRDTIAGDSSFMPARERLAAVDVLTGNINEAIEQYLEMREARPEETWIHTALAHLYHRNEQYDMAVDEFQTAIAMEPENWSLVDDEVEALVADGLLREAIERLHELLEIQGEFADLHVRLADLYGQTGQDQIATKHYCKALDLQPDYIEARIKLGTHHLICGRWEEAAESFHDACELNESLLINYVGMGVAQDAAGLHEEAVNSFELAAAIEPNSTLLLSEMARLQLKSIVAEEFTRNFDTMEIQEGIEVDLDNDDLLHRQLERHAEEIIRRPNHADIRYRYGVLLRAESRLGEAIEQFEKAVEINPNYVRAIIKLGVTQQELGLVDEAIETFRTALEIRPQFVDLHYRLGLLYTDRRQFEDAVQHMEQAATGAPDNEQIRAGLALSLQNMGLMDRAAATWRSLWKLHTAST